MKQTHQGNIRAVRDVEAGWGDGGAVDTHTQACPCVAGEKVCAGDHDIGRDECAGAVAAVWRAEASHGAVEVGRHGEDGSDLPCRP